MSWAMVEAVVRSTSACRIPTEYSGRSTDVRELEAVS